MELWRVQSVVTKKSIDARLVKKFKRDQAKMMIRIRGPRKVTTGPCRRETV